MTNLSNASLLDENVGGNLKNERLQKTAQTAQNPNIEKPLQENQPQPQMQTQQQMPPQMQMSNPQNIERQAQSNISDDEQIPNNLPIRDYGKKQVNNDSDEKKILGMKPALFYGLLGVTLLVGGYFAYKKFGGKGKGVKSVDAGGSTTPIATPKIVDVPITG